MKIKHIASYENDCWKDEAVTLGVTSKDTIEITNETKQAILGFGGCFNELGWQALQLVSEEVRNRFLDELFLEDNCNFNYGRVPIGANDFSLEWYSCDEV